MKLLIVLVGALALVGYSNGLTVEIPEWDLFKFNFDKTYSDVETESMRRNIFEENRKYVESFNAKGDKSYTLKINHLADMSRDELKALNGAKAPESIARNTLNSERFMQNIFNNDAPVPKEMDWRKVPGRVTKAKDQKHCGSCWAFASTGVLEGQQKVHTDFMKKNGTLVSLSEQNLVDCVTTDSGCKGGFMVEAFDYVKHNGIEDEDSYPYEAMNDKCRFNQSKSVMSDAGYALLPQFDEKSLKKMVAKYGPVSVAIDASTADFHLYEKGVYKDSDCSSHPGALNHAVLVVGYGTDPKEGDYWIIKNSWSEQWGQNGFGLFARNRHNMCGIATIPIIATFSA